MTLGREGDPSANVAFCHTPLVVKESGESLEEFPLLREKSGCDAVLH